MRVVYRDINNNKINVWDILSIRATEKRDFFWDFELWVVQDYLGEIEIDKKFSIITFGLLDVELYYKFWKGIFKKWAWIKLGVEILWDINIFPEFKERGYKIYEPIIPGYPYSKK